MVVQTAVCQGWVDATGINAINVCDLSIAQAAGVMPTVGDGKIIAIMSQCANLGEGQTVHSKGQMEHFGMCADDASCMCGGQQHVVFVHLMWMVTAFFS